MVITAEVDDSISTGDSPRQPHCRHHGFGTGIAECHPLQVRQFRNHLGDFTRKWRLRANFNAYVQLLLNGRDQPIGRVPKEVGAKPHRDIDVFISIGIPDLGSL